MENLNKLLGIFTVQLHPTTNLIAMPVGISFYSFKILSYVVDVYKGSRMEKSLGKYALYVIFFPEISSGPIDRGKDLLTQFSKTCVYNYEKVSYGLKLVAWGLFKKIVIADTLSYGVDWVYISYESYKGGVLFIVSIFYTIQIYCDFSGYSDMAVGVAKMLGIELIRNFKAPYISTSVKEFWRRWHISLSTWLRDYIYIPLGGSKKGKARHYANIMVTFLISGLWHGANWNFVLWGGVHGLAQILEDVGERIVPCKKREGKIQCLIKTIAVFLFCNFAWVLFRAESMEQAIYIYFTPLYKFLTKSAV